MEPQVFTLSPTRWRLRWGIVFASIGAGTLMALAALSIISSHDRWIISLVGFVIGLGLADIQLGAADKHPRWVIAGLIAIVLSQAGFHLIIWAILAPYKTAWRFWWITMCASVTISHVIIFFRAATGRGDWFERRAPLVLLVTAAFVAGLALHPKLPAQPHIVYRILLGISAAAATVATGVVAVRWLRHVKTHPFKYDRPHFRTLLVVSHICLLAVGIYIGRADKSERSWQFSAKLAELAEDPARLDATIQSDFARLQRLTARLSDLRQRMDKLDTSLRAAMPNEQYYYTPADEDRIRRLFLNYLILRTDLLRMIGTYASYESVREPRAQAQCFMLGLGAASQLMRASLELVERYHDDKMVRRILNEKHYGIPAGMFDRIYYSAADKRNHRRIGLMLAHFEENKARWQGEDWNLWTPEIFASYEGALEDAKLGIQDYQINRFRVRFDQILSKIKQDAYKPAYAAQKFAAEWIGDENLLSASDHKPKISEHDVKEKIMPLLRAGDILIERRNWYLSNAFLPGFWPHGALYIGHTKDLDDLGVLDDPEVKLHLKATEPNGYDGAVHSIIEAVSEGVIFNTAEHSMHADYVAILRPRNLSRQQIATAIKQAFRHHHKEYDFEFDFSTADRLVCTELVYRAYQGMIDFQDPKTGMLPKIMGRHTLPADDIIRKYAREYGKPDAELELVVFVDWDPFLNELVYWTPDKEGAAEAFIKTLERPGAFNE